MDTSQQPVLKIAGLTASYGQVKILSDIDFSVQPGQSLAILGANGSGKTTLLRSISAIMVKRSGSILLEGREIVQSSPHAIVRLGLSQVPEGKHLFKSLTVRQNLEIGSLPLQMAGRHADVKEASALVHRLFPRLSERLDQSALTLSGGEQQMLAIGRALMSRPKILLLDEPSVGLAPKVNELLFAALASLKALGVTIIVAEQLVQLACAFADEAVVMHLGKIAMRGKATEVRDNPQIRELYLGT